MARNERENDDSIFLRALYSVYKKMKTIFFHTLLTIHCFVVSRKYFKKLISIKILVLGFLKILCICIITLIKLYSFGKRKIGITHHCTPNSTCTCILPHVH